MPPICKSNDHNLEVVSYEEELTCVSLSFRPIETATANDPAIRLSPGEALEDISSRSPPPCPEVQINTGREDLVDAGVVKPANGQQQQPVTGGKRVARQIR
jgi:hypothetical protein